MGVPTLGYQECLGWRSACGFAVGPLWVGCTWGLGQGGCRGSVTPITRFPAHDSTHQTSRLFQHGGAELDVARGAIELRHLHDGLRPRVTPIPPSSTQVGAPGLSPRADTARSPQPATQWGPPEVSARQILRDPPSQQPKWGPAEGRHPRADTARSPQPATQVGASGGSPPPGRYCEIPQPATPVGASGGHPPPGRYREIPPASNPSGGLRRLSTPGQILRDLPSQQPQWGAPGGLPPGRYCEPPEIG